MWERECVRVCVQECITPKCVCAHACLQDPVLGKFLVRERLLEYLGSGTGGVRLEDNVLVTAQGAESLTCVPRTVLEVERVMAGEAWPLKV